MDTITAQLLQTGVKISELPAATQANDTDQFEVNQSGTSRSITYALLKATIFDGTLSAEMKQWLVTPTSANLRLAMPGETTGTGALVFAHAPQMDDVVITDPEFHGGTSDQMVISNATLDGGFMGSMTGNWAGDPNFTGAPTVPTIVTGTNTDQRIVNVATMINQFNLVMPGFAPINSPIFTGDPRAPTPATSDNDTSIATTAYVKANIAAIPPADWGSITGIPATFPPTLPIAQSGVTNLVSDLALKAPIASPAFTGIPTAPTPAPGDNDTSIATTAFVAAAIASGASITVGTTPPVSPNPNQLWWNSETGQLFLFYADGSSSQWVPAAAPGSMAQGPRLLGRVVTTAGQSSAYFPNLPSDINDLEVRFSAIPTAGGSQFYLALLDAAGATIGSAYNWQGSYANSASAAGTAAPMISNVSAGGGYNTAFYMTANVDVSTATGIIGRATLNNIRSTVTRKNCEWSALFNNSANTAAYTFSIHGYNSTTAPISGVILAFNLTTFAAGSVVSLYGSP